MDSATENNPNKRVRFTTTNAHELGHAAPTTPSAALNSYVISSFVSLPTATKSLATHYCLEFIKLKNKVYHQQLTASKLATDGYVPKSARIKFELGATTRVKETEDFKTLADTV